MGRQDFQEFLKLEDQMAKLKPVEAMGAGITIAVMVAGSLGIRRADFIRLVGEIFDRETPSMKKGEHWLIQSRRVDPRSRN